MLGVCRYFISVLGTGAILPNLRDRGSMDGCYQMRLCRNSGRQAQVLRGDGPEDAWLVRLERRRKLRPQEAAGNPRAIVPGSILGIS
jgi:hypothetical protein